MKVPLVPDYDPPKHEREYFTHRQTGDMGWMVFRGHKPHVKYDRPGSDQVIPYRERDWMPRTEPRPLSPAQLAEVCFAADRQLCRRLGYREKADKTWESLSPQEKKQWIEEGPKGGDREALYATIWSTLKHLVE